MKTHNSNGCSHSHSDENALSNDASRDLAEEFKTGSSLPCLFTNITAEQSSQNAIVTGLEPQRVVCSLTYNTLNSSQKRTACTLAWNVDYLASKFGLNNLGFLTLTFSDHVLCPKEANRRFNNLRKHVLSKRYKAYIRVLERMKSGRIHYHLLVVMSGDIRTGFSFAEAEKGKYISAGNLLRNEWAFWRENAKKYGFGRTELMPVKSTAEGIARYIGKYIGKHIAQRKLEDKGVKLVHYSKEARMASCRISMLTKGHANWRAKCKLFGYIMGERLGREPLQYKEFSEILGPRWAYYYRQDILDLPDVFDMSETLPKEIISKENLKEYVDANGEVHQLKIRDYCASHAAKKF